MYQFITFIMVQRNVKEIIEPVGQPFEEDNIK